MSELDGTLFPAVIRRALNLRAQCGFLFVVSLLGFGCVSRVQSTRPAATLENAVEREPVPDDVEPSEEVSSSGRAPISDVEAARQRAVVSGIRSRLRDIQQCYETLLVANPELNGRVRVFFTLDVDGTVSKARATLELRASGPLAECIVDIIRRRFPPGAAGDYEYPFVFAPQN